VADRTKQYRLLADEDLLAVIRGGDAGAFAVLYDHHCRAAYSLAYRMMRDRQAAEDLVQEAFLKIWRSAGGYRAERASVRTWILSVVEHQGIDDIRAAASRQRKQERFEALAARTQPSEAFAETWRTLRREQVRRALRALPPEQEQAVELAYFAGNSHTEIAELLRLPLGTVKGRLRLGLKKLRDNFGLQDAAARG
jgi:RNA polymerase sigma-70 factor (ECF subfamily)